MISFLAATLVLVGGTLQQPDGPPLANATVVIDGARIVSVQAGGAAPAGAQVLDVSGKVITAGLFDGFTRLGLVEVDSVGETRDVDAGGGRRVRADHRVIDSFNADSALIPIQRAHGITTVLSAPDGGLFAGQASVFDLDLPDGESLVLDGAGMVLNLGGRAETSRAAVLARVREVLDDARFYAKNRKALEKNQLRPVAARRLDLEALQPVVDGRQPLLVKVDRKSDILAVLRLAQEQKVRIVLVGATEAWMLAERLARERVPVIIDPVLNAPESFDQVGARLEAAAILEKAGVRVVLSTFSAHNVRKLRQWAGNAVRAGMTGPGALAAITSGPAAVFGLTDRGRVAPGQVANVVVWSGDPFEGLTLAETVIVRGRVMPPETRQRALLEKYRRMPARR